MQENNITETTKKLFTKYSPPFLKDSQTVAKNMYYQVNQGTLSTSNTSSKYKWTFNLPGKMEELFTH